MKKNILIIGIILIKTTIFAQTSDKITDIFLKNLHIDSSQYIYSNYKHTNINNIFEVNTKYGILKIENKSNKFIISLNDNILKGYYYSNYTFIDDFSPYVTVYKSDWLIFTQALDYEKTFVIVQLKNKNFHYFNNISQNCYFLNDYKNDNIIDFFQLDYKYFNKNIGDFSRISVKHYKYLDDKFILQNDTVPKNTFIYYYYKCGCYTRKID